MLDLLPLPPLGVLFRGRLLETSPMGFQKVVTPWQQLYDNDSTTLVLAWGGSMLWPNVRLLEP